MHLKDFQPRGRRRIYHNDVTRVSLVEYCFMHDHVYCGLNYRARGCN